MARDTFETLAAKATVPWLRKAYKLISKRAGPGYVADSKPEPVRHTPDDFLELKGLQYEAVKAARVKDGQHFQTLEECVGGIRAHFVQDGIWNPLTGIGSVDDPGMYQYAYLPVSMSPQEATSYYASGGIPKVIIDKKSKGILLNGYQFEGEGWSPGELKQLHDYAELIGFGEAMSNGVRDGLIYGGSVLYPRLKDDDTSTLEMSVEELLDGRVLKQNSIDHFVTADRWNTVLVPNWNVTARDYLHPEHYYIPIGGVKVATERSAIIRPNELPYWGMLSQMGWGLSDFEGYISPILAYIMIVMSIPIMAQQMSLLYHEIPLDGIIAMSGGDPEGPVGQLIQQNNLALKTWSFLHPQTINSFGKLGAIERHYEGFEELVMVVRQDIAARSEIPESVLFHTTAKGLGADNEEDTTLKEGATIKKVGVAVRPQLKPVARMVAYSCFGPDYFTGDRERLIDTIGVSFDSPTIQTPKELAESGGKFAEMVNKLVGSDIPVDLSVDISRKFFPSVEIDEASMARLRVPSGTMAPEGYGGAAELAGAMEKGNLIEQLLRPGAYAGMPASMSTTEAVEVLSHVDFSGAGGGNGNGHAQDSEARGTGEGKR